MTYGFLPPCDPVPNVDVSGFHVRDLRVQITPRAFGRAEVRVSATVRDRDTGNATEINSWDILDLRAPPHARGRAIRGAILRLLAHELDENLKIDGEWQDPHK